MMNNNNKSQNDNNKNSAESLQSLPSDLNDMGALDQYLKSSAGTRQGRSIPPLDKWEPKQVMDMDLVIKANGEWWHEGRLVTRQSLVDLFATVLWKEKKDGKSEYFLKTPVQKLRITVEDAPLLINDVGIVKEEGVNWLEFTTTTGDVVRLDEAHPMTLHAYQATDEQKNGEEAGIDDANLQESVEQVRPYMLVRNNLTALIGRNTFYHLIEIGELTEEDDITILTLNSGGKDYQLSMPNH